jgi:hypothetical protein
MTFSLILSALCAAIAMHWFRYARVQRTRYHVVVRDLRRRNRQLFASLVSVEQQLSLTNETLLQLTRTLPRQTSIAEPPTRGAPDAAPGPSPAP